MKKNALEWIVFGLSALLLLALLGYLGVKSYTFQDTPPDLRVTSTPETDPSNRNIYRIELLNHGEQTAENVSVEVTLLRQGQVLEKAVTLFPLAPKESVQKAWVTFRSPKQEGNTTSVHIQGYNQP